LIWTGAASTIAESKGHKSRQVWMADDLTAYCRAFHAHAAGAARADHVLLRLPRQRYTKVGLDKTSALSAQAGITPCGEHQPGSTTCASMATHRLPVGPAGQRPRRRAAIPVGIPGPRPAVRHLLLIPLVPDTAQRWPATCFSALLPEVAAMNNFFTAIRRFLIEYLPDQRVAARTRSAPTACLNLFVTLPETARSLPWPTSISQDRRHVRHRVPGLAATRTRLRRTTRNQRLMGCGRLLLRGFLDCAYVSLSLELAAVPARRPPASSSRR